MDIKRVAVVTGITLATWMIMILAVVGVVFMYDRVANPSEDSADPLLNCYVYGDGECGRDGPWHGFVNLF